jgi:hypothetical protein
VLKILYIFKFSFFPLNVHLFMCFCFFAMLDQMDRSWVHGRLFSYEHIDGVKEFMNFMQGKFSEDEQILCPCGRFLNQKHLSGFIMERGWM